MPYREKKIYAGNYLEVEIYPITKQERRQPRKKKEKVTVPKQRNLNDKNSKKYLIRKTHANFTDDDLFLTFTYNAKHLPSSHEETKRDMTNYLRSVDRYRKKNSLPKLKWIAVIEYGEGRRIHHHIIMSGMDRDIAEGFWKKGRANANRLKADENGYEGLVRYITKDPQGKRRWSCSRNLEEPVIRVNDNKYSKRKAEKLANAPDDSITFEKLYPGYVLTECKANFNDINAGTYLYIKMRKLKL